MAEGLNRVLLLGNLGVDPELRTTQSGDAVLRLRLATTERYLDKSKAWQERTEWHSITVWGKRGEALHRILAKGSTVFVEGSLRTSSYVNKEGQKQYKTEVIAQNIILAGGRSGRAALEHEAEGGFAPRSAPRPAAPAAPPGGAEEYEVGGYGDDDIPF